MKDEEGKLVLKDVRKHYPPDVTACIFFLKNRLKERWRNVQERHVVGELKSADELLIEIRKGILELQAEGVDLLALPAPSKTNGNG
jgi:hypothetical protein